MEASASRITTGADKLRGQVTACHGKSNCRDQSEHDEPVASLVAALHPRFHDTAYDFEIAQYAWDMAELFAADEIERMIASVTLGTTFKDFADIYDNAHWPEC